MGMVGRLQRVGLRRDANYSNGLCLARWVYEMVGHAGLQTGFMARLS